MKKTTSLRLVGNGNEPETPPPALSPDLLAGLASAIAQLVDARVEQRLALFKAAAQGAEPDFYDGRTSPLGRRRHDRLARSGELGPEARKVGRRWLVPAAAIRAFIASGKEPAAPTRPAPPPAAVDGDLEAMRRDCGLQTHGARR